MSAWSKFSKLGCQSWLVGIELIDPRLAFDFIKRLEKNDKKFLKILYEKIEKPFLKKLLNMVGIYLSNLVLKYVDI